MNASARTITRVFTVFILTCGFTFTLSAKEDTTKTEDDNSILDELSLADILNMDITTASKQAEKLSDAPGIISVLTKDDLMRFGGTTFKDILDRIPGIICMHAAGTNPTVVTFRGDQIKQTSGHVLFLINGRPVREIMDEGTSSEIIETFPVNSIERVEVIKGPGSVLYGSDAFSGVINIITEQPEKTTTTVSSYGGSGGAFGTQGRTSLINGDFSMNIAGKYLQKDVWDVPYTYQPAMSFTGPSIISQIAKVNNIGSGLYGDIRYKGLSFMSSYTNWTGTNFTDGANETKFWKLFTNLGYTQKILDNWSIDANVTYTPTYFYCLANSERNSSNLVAEVTSILNFSEKVKLVFGGLFNRNAGVEKMIPGPNPNLPPLGDFDPTVTDGSISSGAGYAQVNFQLLKSLSLIGGFQAIKVEDIDLKFVPRLGAIWHPIEQISVKALYSEAFRSPSVDEKLMRFGAPGFDILLGNKKLKPEEISTIDASISYQGEKSQVAINFFHSKQKNIIGYVPNFQFPYIYKNLDKIEFTGGELEGKYYLNKELYMTASALYQTNKNDKIENAVPVPNFGAKGGISYASENGIVLSLFDTYQGDIDKRFKGGPTPSQGAYNLINAHTNFDFTRLFNWQMKQSISGFVNIDNVLDKPYIGFAVQGNGNNGMPWFPGRTVYIGFGLTL